MKKIVLIAIVFVAGCAQSSIPPDVTLDRYSSVAMMPLSEFEETGAATRNVTIAGKDCLSRLFQKEGLNFLPDFASISNIPPEERLRVLTLSFSYKINVNLYNYPTGASATILLNDMTGRQVFSSTGKSFGCSTQQDCLANALKPAFNEFVKNYSGFDPNLAQAYIKEWQDKYKNWERIDVNEVTLRAYVDKNIDTLDPIEGIWVLNRAGWYRTKIGILRDTKSPERDFVGVRLEIGTITKPGHINAEFQKTAKRGVYFTTLYKADCSKQIVNATISDDGSLEFNFPDTNTGKIFTFSHIKIYPHKITITHEPGGASPKAEPEITSPKATTQGTGFAISENGLIVTAYHVIKHAKIIKVHLTKDSFVSAKVIQGDPVNDLAVLKMEKATPSFLKVAPMRSVKAGDRVFTIGFPVSSVLGQEAKYTEGVVSSLSGLDDASSFLQISVPVQPGNSGGALVDENGQVVGIITSTAALLPFIKESGTLPQNVNWAVKADYLRPLLELPKAGQEQLNREQAIILAKKSTFLIEAE